MATRPVKLYHHSGSRLPWKAVPLDWEHDRISLKLLLGFWDGEQSYQQPHVWNQRKPNPAVLHMVRKHWAGAMTMQLHWLVFYTLNNNWVVWPPQLGKETFRMYLSTYQNCCGVRADSGTNSELLSWRDSLARAEGLCFPWSFRWIKKKTAGEEASVWPSIINERIKSKTLSDTDTEAL